MSFEPDDEQGGGTGVIFVGLALLLVMIVGTAVWPMLASRPETSAASKVSEPTSGRVATPTDDRHSRLEWFPPAEAGSTTGSAVTVP